MNKIDKLISLVKINLSQLFIWTFKTNKFP